MPDDEKVREYWEDPDTVSLVDENLRRLEEGAVLKHLELGARVLDVGCGDGRSTIKYAECTRNCVGLERSKHLLNVARARPCDPTVITTLSFLEGDVRNIPFPDASFDAVVSQRCLINLPTLADQFKALTEMSRVLRRGGVVVLLENTRTGAAELDEFRKAVGLEPIPVHWHNLYFHSWDQLDYLTRAVGFDSLNRRTFGLYYLLTRVYANLVARFEGFGKDAKKDPIFDKLDEAARNMQEKLGACGLDCGPVRAFFAKKT